MPYAFNTCRFCHEASADPMVKYGTRHYAHHHCYLNAGKTLDPLPKWMCEAFPYLLLKEHGLLNHPKLKQER